MATKHYSLRVSDDSLISEIADYAAKHAIPESTAIARLLAEGRKAREGKPITRFAVLDPAAATHFSMALGELRDLGNVLRRCRAALARPRPVSGQDVEKWENEKKCAAEAFALAPSKIAQLRKAGHLELLLHDINPRDIERLYQNAIEKDLKVQSVLYGALLGKNPPRKPNDSAKNPAVTHPEAPQAFAGTHQPTAAPKDPSQPKHAAQSAGAAEVATPNTPVHS